MLKKDTLGTASRASLQEAFKCGECLHFKNLPHRSKGEACIKLGIRPSGIAPSCYTPDVSSLCSNADEFVQLALLFSNYSSKQKKILLGLLRRSTKSKFEFGTKYYIKVGRDYIGNYLCGYVGGTTSAGDLILLGAPKHTQSGSIFLAYLKKNTVLLAPDQWKVKRNELAKKGKFKDPEDKRKKITLSILKEESYEVPTIDSNLVDAESNPKKRPTLVDRFSF